MKANADPEDGLASLSQEATNHSTPDKSLAEQTKRKIPRRKMAKRTKAPDA